MAGISNTGTYNFEDNTWVAKSETDNIKDYVYFTGDLSIATATSTALQENNALMLIPQSLTANSKIVLNYNVLQNGVIIRNISNEELSLAGTTWEAGKKIRYILDLKAEGVTVSFTASVDGWDEPETDPLNPVTPPAK